MAPVRAVSGTYRLPASTRRSPSCSRRRAAATPTSGALREDDIGLAYYDGDEIDLTPLVHEHTLLALPTRPLCARGVSRALLALRREPQCRPVWLSRQRDGCDAWRCSQTLLRER